MAVFDRTHLPRGCFFRQLEIRKKGYTILTASTIHRTQHPHSLRSKACRRVAEDGSTCENTAILSAHSSYQYLVHNTLLEAQLVTIATLFLYQAKKLTVMLIMKCHPPVNLCQEIKGVVPPLLVLEITFPSTRG